MGTGEDPELEREFRVLMARVGIDVPPDRFAGALAGYADVKRMAARLRTPRDAESEPPNVFDVTRVLRVRDPR